MIQKRNEKRVVKKKKNTRKQNTVFFVCLLKQQKFMFLNSGEEKSKIKVLAGLFSSTVSLVGL